jgi:hypothetical protein
MKRLEPILTLLDQIKPSHGKKIHAVRGSDVLAMEHFMLRAGAIGRPGAVCWNRDLLALEVPVGDGCFPEQPERTLTHHFYALAIRLLKWVPESVTGDDFWPVAARLLPLWRTVRDCEWATMLNDDIDE